MIKSIDCNKLIVKLLDPKFPVRDLDSVVDLIAACSVDVDSVEHGYWRDGKVRGSYALLCSECGCDTGVNYHTKISI